jgi:hypothetical protein
MLTAPRPWCNHLKPFWPNLLRGIGGAFDDVSKLGQERKLRAVDP